MPPLVAVSWSLSATVLVLHCFQPSTIHCCESNINGCLKWTVKDKEDDSACKRVVNREPRRRVWKRGERQQGDRWRWLQHSSFHPPGGPSCALPQRTSPLLIGLRLVAARHRAGSSLPCIFYYAKICSTRLPFCICCLLKPSYISISYVRNKCTPVYI